MTEEKRLRPVEEGRDPAGPRDLPYSAYPKAVDVAHHGLQPLPTSLPLVDFARAKPYRSSRHTTVLATELTKDQLLQMVWVIATGLPAAIRRPATYGCPSIRPRGSWGRATPTRSVPTRSVRGARRRRCTG